MKNILKRLNIFAMLIAIVSNVFVVTPIAAEHEHDVVFCLMVRYYQCEDENQHRYYTGWEARCDCGAKLGITEETCVLESHYWNGDICRLCDYKRPHTHQGVNKGNEVRTLKSYDENTHTYSIAYESLCSCGELVGFIDETTTTTEHNFENYKCVECGYIKSHTHTGVTRGNKVTTLKSYDENTHTYSVAYENLCSCGESAGLTDETTTTTKHNFKNDKCTECGYTKSHTHKGVTKGKAVTSLKSYDEKTHTYVTAYENLCSCGESVGLIDETTNTANHSFKDDKCTECGYITKNPAKDEQSILGDFFEDANVDGVAAEITVGEIPDSGLVVEVSSLLANKNIVGANLPELVPLIGSLKYSDEVYTVVKNADDLENIIENANGFYEIARAVVIRKDEA